MNNVYEECNAILLLDRQQIEQRLNQYQFQLGDVGLDNWSMEVLAKKDRENLRRVMNAQERMDTGRYGVCLTCGRPIEPDRLLALATAETCVACNTRAARMQLKTSRHYSQQEI
jgi:RNA polymerase-binding transcription factor DksA